MKRCLGGISIQPQDGRHAHEVTEFPYLHISTIMQVNPRQSKDLSFAAREISQCKQTVDEEGASGQEVLNGMAWHANCMTARHVDRTCLNSFAPRRILTTEAAAADGLDFPYEWLANRLITPWTISSRIRCIKLQSALPCNEQLHKCGTIPNAFIMAGNTIAISQ